MKTLWLADWESDTDNYGCWFIFPSESGDYEKARRKFKQVFKQEYGRTFIHGFDITELNSVEGHKIKLVKENTKSLGQCPECGHDLQYENVKGQVNLRIIECSACSYTKETSTKQGDIVHH